MGDAIPEVLIEETAEKYEFIRELGRGGMGIVYLARDLELGRLVAVKVLSPSLLAEESMVERFRREARTIASMRHESIVTIHGVGRAGSLHYFVMDFIEGASLSRLLRAHGPLSIPIIRAILYQVGSALGYGHQPGRGIVHRDVKPSNVLLDSVGNAVVMDFGIAKVSESPGGLTKTGVFMGTPEYMSPEQCRQHEVTPASDQYALGAVLYAMLTGAPPYTGPWYRVALAHEADPIPSVVEARPDCPPDLAEATERMLAKSPGDRWPDISAALKAIGLHPLATDDPVRKEIADLVSQTMESSRAPPVSEEEPSAGAGRTPASLKIAAIPDGVEEGDELRLSVSMIFDDGAEEENAAVVWESTNPGIAEVDSQTGELVAVGVGMAEIVARSEGIVSSVAVEIKHPRVVQVAIDPTDIELAVGETAVLNAHPKNKRGEGLDRPVTWSSSDPRTLEVSETGELRALKEGSASVLAVCEGAGASLEVKVLAGAMPVDAASQPDTSDASSITIFPPPSDLTVADTFHLVATAHDEKDRPLERAISWDVGDSSVLETLGVGRFRAVGEGETEVIAKTNGVTQRVSVQVTKHLAEETRPISAAETVWYEEVVAPVGAPEAREVVEAKPAIPAGSRRVLYWGVPVLAAAVVALFQIFGGDPVAEVSLVGPGGSAVGSGLVMRVEETISLSAVARDEKGSELESSFEWFSSDVSVATVDALGTLVAVAGGTARITAQADGVFSSELTVSVDIAIAEIAEIAILNAASGQRLVEGLPLDSGAVVALVARLLDESGGELGGRTVDWSSLDSNVAAVRGVSDIGAEVTGLASGEALIVASAEGVQEQISVTVSSPAPVATRPVVTPPPPSAAAQPNPNGVLLLRMSPRGFFYVNGVRRNQETLRTLELSLPAGEYRLRFEGGAGTAFIPIEMDTTVVSSDTTVVIRNLQRGDGR